MDVPAAVANVLDRCLGVQAGERVVLLTDTGSDRRVTDLLLSGIEARSAAASTLEMAPLDIPGAEVAPDVARTMAQSDAVIELTSIFIGSNEARRDANAVGVRYLAMPGITLDTLRADGPLSVDFDELRARAEQVGELWTQASEFRLTTAAGDIHRFAMDGRWNNRY